MNNRQFTRFINFMMLVGFAFIFNPPVILQTEWHHTDMMMNSGVQAYAAVLLTAFCVGLPGVRVRDLGISRRFWSENRDREGLWETLLTKVETFERIGVLDKIDEKYNSLFRMNALHFHMFVEEFGAFIEPLPDWGARGIPADKRLAIVLNWLATGDSHQSLADK